MRSEDICGFLRRQPFQPFRLTLADGRTYEILHPNMAIVGRSFVAVGLAQAAEPDGIYDRVVTVDLVQIMQLEPLESVARPPGH